MTELFSVPVSQAKSGQVANIYIITIDEYINVMILFLGHVIEFNAYLIYILDALVLC